MKYFAYGSNLATQRLLARLPEARDLGIATLGEHRINFGMNHNDESAKCDIEFTGNPQDLVYGVVYAINVDQKRILDAYEMLGVAYDEKQVEVIQHGNKITAISYFALLTQADQLLPFHWYKAHVVNGAIEHGFPAEYVATLRAFPSQDDPDQTRADREEIIYK